MGLNSVTVETAEGKVIREIVASPSVLDPLIGSLEDKAEFCCLRFVDPYGDTIFNPIQVVQLRQELETLLQLATTPNQRSVIQELLQLAQFSLMEPHRFLRLVGD